MAAETIQFADKSFPIDTERIALVNVSPSDFEELRGLTQLKELRIEQTNPHASVVSAPLDLDALADLKHLEVLIIPKLTARDISPLASLPALKELDLSRSRVQDLSPLQKSKSLKILRLRATKITDIKALSGLSQLT